MKQNQIRSLLEKLFIMILLAGLIGCSRPDYEIEVRTIDDEEVRQRADQLKSDISTTVSEGLEVSLWAPEKLIGDPVAIDVDHLGRILVTVTGRRRGSVLDIRGHRDWFIESIMMETVEDRRDFLHRELSPERSDENRWLEDYNRDGSHDWRDLTVNKESVFRLEDLTGNGNANQATLFIRDFHDEITDITGAVLNHQGNVYLGVAPDMWRIRDTNNDGYGDTKQSISHGYGVNIGFGGHGMSGLTVGPDGRLYWSIGDRGASIEDQEGNRWHNPRQGVIVRSDPDGSNFEVFARGLRNTHEFSFDKYGNLITVDNDGDHPGEYERLVYLIDGSDSGWRTNWQFGKYSDPLNNRYNVFMDEDYHKPRFDGQAAHLLPPLARYHNGPAGMAYNPGTALGEQWNDHFFMASFVGSPARSGIYAFTLQPSGASFVLDKDEKILEGLLVTGVDFGPDGALYFADWVEGWERNEEGRIWKLDVADGQQSSVRLETKRILAEDFGGQSTEQLLEFLKHDDMRVRQNAQFELAARDDTESLRQAAVQTGHQLKRIHGIWGLSQIGRRSPDAVQPLISLLDDDDAEVRAQAAKMLGDVRYEPGADALTSLLDDEQERVRYFATEALGRLSWRPALEAIVDMLEANNDEDVYLRQGGAIALARIGDTHALAELSNHPSKAVKIAAVIALKRLDSPEVVRFLDDEDEFIVTNAARAINDDIMIEEGLNALAGMLEQDRFDNEPLIRRAINACLYHGTERDANRLANFAANQNRSQPLRVEALQTLSVWAKSSRLDRVTGDPRGSVENDPDVAQRAIDPVMADILSEKNPELQIAGLQVVSRLNIADIDSRVLGMVSEDPSSEVRMKALQTLADIDDERIEEAVFAALEDADSEVRMNALQMITGLPIPEENMVSLVEPLLEQGTIPEKQAAFRTLVRIQSEAVIDLLDQQLQLLLDGDLAPEIELELVQAAESKNSEKLEQKLHEFRQNKQPDVVASAFSESLYGGNGESGQRIFYQNTAAQCLGCHVVDGEGSDVGPDLTNVADRLNREELLEAMVNPNARIAPGYGSVTLTLDSGETISGMLAAETNNQITITHDGEQIQIDKADIKERRNSPSGMPAMGELLSRSELRDLVEYLMTLTSKDFENN